MAAFSGCRLRVHTYYTIGLPPYHHELGDYEFMPGLRTEAQVMLRLTSPEITRGHFLRLVSEAEWQEFLGRMRSASSEPPSHGNAASSAKTANSGPTRTSLRQDKLRPASARRSYRWQHAMGRKWRLRKKRLAQVQTKAKDVSKLYTN